jgi:hypothetical protein
LGRLRPEFVRRRTSIGFAAFASLRRGRPGIDRARLDAVRQVGEVAAQQALGPALGREQPADFGDQLGRGQPGPIAALAGVTSVGPAEGRDVGAG